MGPLPVPARQRSRRLARAALALVPPAPQGWPSAGLTHLALDSVRCGRWELFVLGVVWHGRVLPVGGVVLPYPWPKGRSTPTGCALLRRVAAAWPAEQRAHLLADRGFPSHKVFQRPCGRSAGAGRSVRGPGAG